MVLVTDLTPGMELAKRTTSELEPVAYDEMRTPAGAVRPAYGRSMSG
jgi:hypothetical protein